MEQFKTLTEEILEDFDFSNVVVIGGRYVQLLSLHLFYSFILFFIFYFLFFFILLFFIFTFYFFPSLWNLIYLCSVIGSLLPIPAKPPSLDEEAKEDGDDEEEEEDKNEDKDEGEEEKSKKEQQTEETETKTEEVKDISTVEQHKHESGATKEEEALPPSTKEYYSSISPFKSSDIDLCIYGLTNEEFLKKLVSIYNHLKKKVGGREVKVYQSSSNVVLSALFPYRHVQISLMYVTFLLSTRSFIVFYILHFTFYILSFIFMLILILYSDHSGVFGTSSLVSTSTALRVSPIFIVIIYIFSIHILVIISFSSLFYFLLFYLFF